jgi:DNA polymerase-3 subunit beta
MELNFQREDLLRALQRLQSIAATRNTLPILSNALISAEGSEIVMAATDLEVGIKLKVPGTVASGGSITIPVRKFVEIVRELPSDEVRVKTLANDRIEINYDRGSYKIVGLPSDEFPSFPEPGEGYLMMDSDVLVGMIGRTAFAASAEEGSFYDGVYFHLTPNSVRMVASDRRRLAMMSERIETPVEEETGVIIPLKAVNEFAKNFGGSGEIRVFLEENQIVFQGEDKTLVSRLIEGSFPDYEAIIPQSSQIRIVADTQEMLGVVRRVSLLADPKTLMIVMDVSDGKLALSANTPDFGEAYEEMDLKESIGEIKIAFMARYISDVLRNINCEEIVFEFNEPLSPAVVRPADSDNYIYLIMPMRME